MVFIAYCPSIVGTRTARRSRAWTTHQVFGRSRIDVDGEGIVCSHARDPRRPRGLKVVLGGQNEDDVGLSSSQAQDRNWRTHH